MVNRPLVALQRRGYFGFGRLPKKHVLAISCSTGHKVFERWRHRAVEDSSCVVAQCLLATSRCCIPNLDGGVMRRRHKCAGFWSPAHCVHRVGVFGERLDRLMHGRHSILIGKVGVLVADGSVVDDCIAHQFIEVWVHGSQIFTVLRIVGIQSSLASTAAFGST